MDNQDQEVGKVESLFDGLVSRVVGSDLVLLYVTPQGFLTGPVTFYHLTADCSEDRYLPNVNRNGLAFLGQVFGDSIVYSRVVDPTLGNSTMVALASETINLGSDIHARGTCVEEPGGWPQSMGRAVVERDPAGSLLPPFRVR